MNGTADGPLDHDAAASRITQVENRVGRTKRIYVGSVVLLGVITLAYFAVVGGIPRAVVKPYDSLLVLFPVALFFVVVGIRRASTSARGVLRVEQWLLAGYIVAMVVAGALEIFVFRQGTVAAALPGLLPAAVCFAAAGVLGKK
ncbi:hypothetical protein [Amycolatopsis vastitatis]|uniref:Uncharacterized protein n=1 Tax=Amycolatopsis vastitatis TaxID=1905142 RepID=A0A229TBA9_9PSEU|nr:hypothetical protein [Amycolatopsis vastitatis]OXM68438.1 hypothetical protein CF165_13070 [Amycolatopsis vastitatis]